MEDGSGIMSTIAQTAIEDVATGLSIISGESKEAKKQFSVFGTVLTAIKISLEVLITTFKFLILPFRIMIDLAIKLAKRFDLIRVNTDSVRDSMAFFVQVLNNIPEIIGRIVDVITGFFLGLTDAVVGGAKVFRGFFQGIADGFTFVGTLAKDFGKILANIFDEEERKKAVAKFIKDLGKDLISVSASKDIKDGSDAIGRAFLGGITDGISKATFEIKKLFEDDEILVAAEKAGEDQENARQKGAEAARKAGQKQELIDQEKGEKELLLFRQKQAITIAKENSAIALKELKDSEEFNKEKLQFAINAIEQETDVIKSEIALRNAFLLENEKLTAFEIQKIKEAEAEEIRLIEQDAARRTQALREQRVEDEQKTADEIAAIRKKNFKRIAEGLEALIRLQKEASEERLKQLDEQIASSERVTARLEELAKDQSESTEENLAFEQAKRARFEAARETEIQKQKIQELLLTGLRAFSANIQNDPNTALPKTLTQISVLEAALKAIGRGFHAGTDNTGLTGTLKDKHGAITGWTHGNEMVIESDKVNSLKQKGITTRKDLIGYAELGQKAKAGELISNSAIIEKQSFQSNGAFLTAIHEQNQILKDLPDNMPYQSWDFDSFFKWFDHNERKGNVRTKTRTRLKRR